MDTRSTLRFPVDLPARLWIGETELSARIRNLSLGGVLLIGPTLPVGTRVRLRFKAPHVAEFDGGCVTRWTTADGCGLQFDAQQLIDSHQLAALIRSSRRASERLPTDAILRPAR